MSKNTEAILSADVVKSASGRQYHINVAPGEVASFIILCGDPARAERISALFDSIDFRKANREYLTYTGKYCGIPVSVMATGIGCDNTEIAFIELYQCVENPTFIRVGSCGGLQKETKLGDLIISTGSLRRENTSTYFVPESYPALANYEVILALIDACQVTGLPYHVGMTASASGFYGAQGRKVPGFTPREPNIDEELARLGIMNFEMESSTLFTLASLGKVRAGAVCAVYANRYEKRFITPEEKDQAEMNAITAGLGAIRRLVVMDEAKKKAGVTHWYPSIEEKSKDKGKEKKGVKKSRKK